MMLSLVVMDSATVSERKMLREEERLPAMILFRKEMED